MPIYAYRCTDCGHAKDVLQRMSDPLLHTCPACGAEAFTKQVTAAGFQLKGSGWYATDFKGSGAAPATGVAVKDKSADQEGQSSGDKSAAADSKSADSKPADTPSSPAAAPSAPAAPSSSPAASTGS
jgi:putative FmdB family regulatory protein